ncbi:hypothetical protein DASC09_036480 [Saccharomycopsis crataegensis]|uniref:DUF221-domain-containing protein n=1 Tax=Saccharomycopsis crataegensis TaxID=43959 RepID=A0AAV5QNG7_9ASCO|nr:hypothetical protein DASC09_036480 [Saccharomycopsis crataegensis]
MSNNNDNDPLPGLDPSKFPQRVFISQLLFSMFIGFFGFLVFCYLRPRYPQIYSLRTLRRSDIETLPRHWFSWIKQLYIIKDEEVLALSGLDAYVFLCFFRISITIFGVLTLISFLFIGPIRYYTTGHYDHHEEFGDGDAVASVNIMKLVGLFYSISDTSDREDDSKPSKPPMIPPMYEEFPSYLWIYAVFTYIFVLLSLNYLLKQTKKIITIRQNYLGSQNSVTDKTIRVDGIPPQLRTESVLKKHIESLGIGKVLELHMNRDWDTLDHYMKERKHIVKCLEKTYISYLGLDVNINKGEIPQASIPKLPNEIETEDSTNERKRPTMKTGFLGLFGTRVDTINYYLIQLKKIDYDIEMLRQENAFKPADSAFVTMDSVASAQMIAQAVLDPKAHNLLTSLAPSPSDIIWESFAVPSVKRYIQNYSITIMFVITSVVLIFPVSSLAALINIETITKFWPKLGHVIADSKWLTTLVTGILPPTLFTVLNVCIPYLYRWLSTKQYFHSNGDVELASVSKNYFYTFFNLFLVFTIAGSAANYWSYFTDTTKIAYQLANSIKKLSLFYNNLILLQGLGIFPYKLMQFGDVFVIGCYKFVQIFYKTQVRVRTLRYLYYTPKIFDFGLILPQHILIFVITMIYSIISTKLLASGLLYFILGYFVYKYQLIYSMIHPQHSTGKVWAIIMHRLIVGLVIFELTMIGTLALENAVILAISLLPLIGLTIWFHFRFEKYYKPLLHFIALRAVKNPRGKRFVSTTNDLENVPQPNMADNETIGNSIFEDSSIADVSTSTDIIDSPSMESLETTQILNTMQRSLRKRRSTFDEDKNFNQSYIYPNLIKKLDGPWVGFEGNTVEVINYDNCELLKNINEDVRIDVRKIDVDKINDKINENYAGEVVVSKGGRFFEWQ